MPPRPLENGLFQATDLHAGGTVDYQCNAGFYLLGDAKLHCTNSGKWGGNPPACLGTSLCNISKIISTDFKKQKATFHLETDGNKTYFSVDVFRCG